MAFCLMRKALRKWIGIRAFERGWYSVDRGLPGYWVQDGHRGVMMFVAVVGRPRVRAGRRELLHRGKRGDFSEGRLLRNANELQYRLDRLAKLRHQGQGASAESRHWPNRQ